MKHFLSIRTTSALFTLALLAVSSAACGGVGASDQLFGNGGGATTGSAAGGSSSGTTATSGTTVSSGTTTTSGITTTQGSCQTGYSCVDDDPTGWTGHYYVNEVQLPAAAAPACPTGLTARTDHASPAGAAQCTACTCGGLTGAACSAPTIDCYIGNNGCAGNAINLTPLYQDGQCHSTAVQGGGGTPFSCKLTSAPMVIAQGTCPPSTSDFPNKEAWQQRIDACGADQSSGSCGSGKVCIPDGPGTAGESLCIRMDGTATCPAAWPKAISGYNAATDSRACTACSCAPGTSCGDAHYTFYSAPNCMTASTSGMQTVGSSNCTDLTNEVTANMGSEKASLPQAKGTCTPSGGTATGSVTPMNPVTYCCKS